ncbi:MAG: hypothetical protein GY860_24635 [Desulfobacteraceae bacterium]|nr:hypothetical protein [Desulfobacteraceae bacterium]
MVDMPPGEYQMIFNSDEARFGGKQRLLKDQSLFTLYDPVTFGKQNPISLYLPTRTAMVLKLKSK